MSSTKNILIDGSGKKPIALDIFFKDWSPKPVVVYAHGFNGFKDWGNFDLIAEQFAGAGFTFIKFNFSHNGTTPEQPGKFVDPEAYGENNYSRELEDLEIVLDWTLDKDNPYRDVILKKSLFLIGHSRGGGIVLIKGAENKSIRGIATWASVSACKTPWGNWSAEKMERWRNKGVEYITNSRTGQNLPVYYQLYEDYERNKKRLDVGSAVKSLQVPVLLCHGSHDEAVPVEEALKLERLNNKASVFVLESDHVFGRKHPWTEEYLPAAMQQVVDKTIDFFKAIIEDSQNP